MENIVYILALQYNKQKLKLPIVSRTVNHFKGGGGGGVVYSCNALPSTKISVLKASIKTVISRVDASVSVVPTVSLIQWAH